ncbi:MAG TPA: hypothetical protein VNT03_02945 [Baekduia sp.]|nr:hypothetical protein [Baekduia sp.]
MGYKILGYVIWNGGKWYVKRRYGGRSARRVAGLGIVGVAVAALVVAGSKRSWS